jgi:hypothetical protein
MQRVSQPLLLKSESPSQIHLNLKGLNGWVLDSSSTSHQVQKKRFHALDQQQPIDLQINQGVFINFGKSALWIKLEAPLANQKSNVLQALTESIGQLPHQFMIAFSFALCIHLALIIYGYASVNYEQSFKDIEISDRFVQIIVDLPKPKEEPVIEKPKDEKVEQVEEVKEVKREEKEQVPPPSNFKETIRQKVKSKFGEGKSAANALADFLEGKSSSSNEERLSLNEASSALGAGLGSGSPGLGDALSAVGGDVVLGGGGGGGGGGALDGILGSGVSKAGGVGKVKGGSGGGGGVKGQVKPMNSQLKATGGSLSKEEIAKVIQQYSSKISNCYEKALMKNSDISGRLQVEWVIEANGSVSDVKQAYSGMTQPDLSACILALFKQMKFPKPQGGSVKVKYPFIFSQR